MQHDVAFMSLRTIPPVIIMMHVYTLRLEHNPPIIFY